MSNCDVKVKVRSGTGYQTGAVVSINSALVAGVQTPAYQLTKTSDSLGEMVFTLPQGAIVRFASTDVDNINGWILTVPNTDTFFAGVFHATPANAVSNRGLGGTVGTGAGLTVVEIGYNKLVFTLTSFLVTLVKNGTSTGGGGSLLYTFPEGLVMPVMSSSNLTVANALDKSFLASLGSAAADTGGTLTSTEISFGPSTAATTSSGAGTCKIKSTVTTPTPGAPLDGTTTATPLYLNSCLNADATGAEALRYTGTITVVAYTGGDN